MDWSGSDGRVVAAGVAVTLVLVAVGWWAVDRFRARRMVARGLCDPDPAVRAAVVTAIAGQGVGAHARRLLVLAEGEDDVEVRDALVAAVLRSQWEPATDPRLLALRVWAHTVSASVSADDGTDPGSGRSVPLPSPVLESAVPDRTRPDAVTPVG